MKIYRYGFLSIVNIEILLFIIILMIVGCENKTEPDYGNSLVLIETTMGDITIELFHQYTPLHASNFMKLVRESFYEGTTFHRVIPGFVIQGGDPNSRLEDRSYHGRGGPGYTIPEEIGLDHRRGYIGAARLGDQVNPERESNGSQFYICLANLPSLDGAYTVFGRVTEGMGVVDAIATVETDINDNPIERVEIKRAYIISN